MSSRRFPALALAIGLGAAPAVVWLGCSGSGGADQSPGGPGPADTDGMTGGQFTFVVSVSDSAFSPAILKAQNLASVTLTLQNTGTTPHGLTVDGIAGAAVGPVAPGASATLSFTTPGREAIYPFRSPVPGDTQAGQFIVQ